MKRVICCGIRRAGVSVIAYAKDGRVLVKSLPAIPKPPAAVPERVRQYG